MAMNILAFAAAIALLYYGRVLLITLLIAIITAFLLDPAVHFFMKLRLPRAVASFVVCSIALLLMYFAALGLYTEASSLLEDLPTYSQRIADVVDQAAQRIDTFEKDAYQLVVPKRYREPVGDPSQQAQKGKRRRTTEPQPPAVQEVRIKPEPTPIISYVYNYVSGFYNILLMASFVPFLVYFMLSWRDHIRRTDDKS